jgi:hypothetical protein
LFRNNDDANALSMLHTSLLASLTGGFERLQAAGESGHQETRELLNSELAKFRKTLTEASNRLVTTSTDFTQDSQAALALLRQVIRELKEETGAPEGAPRTSVQARHTTESSDPGNDASEAQPAVGWPVLPASAEASPMGPGQSPDAEQAPAGESPQWEESPALPAPDSAQPSPRELVEEVTAALRDILEGELTTLRDSWGSELASVRADLDGAREAVAAVREALMVELAPVRAHFGEVQEQLLALRDDFTALRSRLDDPPPAPHGAGALEPEGGTREPDEEAARQHGELLTRAARVSSVKLVCHRDVWEFLTCQAGRHAHFRMPSRIADRGDDRIEAALSGRSLIAVLICLWDTRHTADPGDADGALALTVYDRITQALDELATGGANVTITLDDRAAPDLSEPGSDQHAQPEPAPQAGPAPDGQELDLTGEGEGAEAEDRSGDNPHGPDAPQE